MSGKFDTAAALKNAFRNGELQRLSNKAIETKEEFRKLYLTFEFSLVNDLYLAYSNGYRVQQARAKELIKEGSRPSYERMREYND